MAEKSFCKVNSLENMLNIMIARHDVSFIMYNVPFCNKITRLNTNSVAVHGLFYF